MTRRWFLSSFAGLALAADRYEDARDRMVRNQIESRGIRHRALLAAMRKVPRHLYMPEHVRGQAYADHPVPIGHGQTISQPYIVAYMSEMLDPQSDDRVLEIGTGSGYQAAVLAELSRHVYTVEIVGALARQAETTLKQQGYKNVSVRHGDGYRGWPEKAPFEKIILTAAPPELPKTLVDQLARGGKLIAPVGSTVYNQELILVEKAKDGQVTRRAVLPVRFVPMVRGK